jgi:uncharacterized protein (TIGR02246 family)
MGNVQPTEEIVRILAVLCLMLLPLAARAQTAMDPDTRAIHALVDRFVEAWNRHDVHAFAAVFAEDADFTNWRGSGMSGRSEIEAFHAPMFATIFKESHQKYADIKIRFVRPDVAAVDVRWELTGLLDPQGKPHPDRQGILIFVMSKNAGQWQITVMHNLDLSMPPPAK